jgi:hypothetical protein
MQLRRRTKSASDVAASERDAGDVARATRAILNKIAPDAFERFFSQIIDLISSDEHAVAVAAEVSSKAVTDHAFCPLYTDLCLRLDKHLSACHAASGQSTLFRTRLQWECQDSFDREISTYSNDARVSGLEGEVLYEMEVKIKRIRVGTVRFMAYLFLAEMIDAAVITDVVNQLLQVTSDGGAAIESLVSLLQVISPKYDTFEVSFANVLRDVYATLRGKANDTQLPCRIRCIIQDLIDVLPKTCLVRAQVRQEVPWRRRSGASVWKPKI